MGKNDNSYVSDCESADSEISWTCKICRTLPNYAGIYLCLREREKDKGDPLVDLPQIKYYYSLLHLLDAIHKLPECTGRKSPLSEHFDYYRKMYNTYASVLIDEGLEPVYSKCNICAVLPYALFSDLELAAKNMHSDDMEKAQKLELDAFVTDYYLKVSGPCGRWETCSHGVDWIELMYSFQTLKKYLGTKDREQLLIDLSTWNRARAADNILNTGLKTASRDFQIHDIPPHELEGKAVVYLDFGVYQVYEDNKGFRAHLDTYAEIEKIQFVYSPTHMEEVCRMGYSGYESKRRDSILKFCKDHEVLAVQDAPLKIALEPVCVCFARAKKLQNLNECAEESECAKFEALEEQTCRLLGWDKKKFETHKAKISSFASAELFCSLNETIGSNILNQLFYAICGSSVPLEKFKDFCKGERTFSEIREAVRLLYMLMNALGYHKNKIEKRTQFTHEALYPTYNRKFYRTIRSGFYDVDHLSYASKCDYFVTCDRALSLQAEAIYHYLGCKTKVIYCEKKALDPSSPLSALYEGL